MPSLDWALFMPPLAPSLDSAPFTPCDPPESRFIGAAEGAPRSDGALCWAVEPAGASRPVPVPCALANPVAAISAAAATEIIKQSVMDYLLTCYHCPRRQRSEGGEVPPCCGFHRVCFVNGR